MEHHELLNRLASDEEERVLLGRVWDKYRQCAQRGIPTHTAFLSPAQCQASRRLLGALGAREEEYCFYGGCEGVERQQLHFLPPWQEGADAAAVCAVRCRWYEGDTLSHRDLLGSLMGLGLTRESVGDILIDNDSHSAVVLLSSAVRECVLTQWDKAGRAALRTEEIVPDEVTVPAPEIKEIRDTVSSLRLDNVTAAAFSLSRQRAAEAVESGRVQVNGGVCLKGDRPVAPGDVLSVRGVGKCRLESVGTPNRKGRLGVVIGRYQ